MRRWTLSLPLCLAAGLVLGCVSPALAVFPAAQWETRTPHEQGLDASRLAAFRSAIGGPGAGVVVHDGYLVYSWGDVTHPNDWASATKPIFSTLLAFAVRDGLVQGLDDPIADLGWPLAPIDLPMTFRQLANGTSGYTLPEPPGTAWAYNDYAIKLLTLSLLERIEGIQADERGAVEALILSPSRFGPPQLEDHPVVEIDSGVPRFYGSPRDLARIGWLWLQRGAWSGQQLLPAALVDEMLRPQVPDELARTAGSPVIDYLQVGSSGGGADQTGLGPGILGMGWWFDPERGTWPDAPADTYQANGHWNRSVVTVIPSRRLVAAWTWGQEANPESFVVPMNAIRGGAGLGVQRRHRQRRKRPDRLSR
jgi:CubicO group peptidase (beta-lactamase class C family)